MVIKFDHVSYSCEMNEDYSHILTSDYFEVFREVGLPNAPCKNILLCNGANKHDIVLYHSKTGGLPIEITAYPNMNSQFTYMSISENVIIINVNDLKTAINFFSCFDMVVTTTGVNFSVLRIVTVLDKIAFYIKLIEKEIICNKAALDNKGYSSVALFVDNVERILKKCEQKGFSITEISPVYVNGRKLLVAFAIGRNMEIVELISLNRG